MTTPVLRLAEDIDLPVDVVTESSAILAKKGAGKTNAGIVLLEEALAAGVPVVSIDPKGDHWGIRAGADGTPDGGLPVAVFGGLHADIPLEPTAGAFIADLIRERRLSAVLDVSEFTVGERARFLTAFADRLYRRPEKEPLLLLLEEAHEYIPQQVRGESARMVGAFERLVKLGRFKGIGVVMVTQRSASLNKNVLTQADNLFLLRTTSPQDRAAAKAWMDTNQDSAAIADALPRLATGETFLLQPERGEPLHFTWRLRHTYDAGRTPKVGEAPRPPAALADVDLDAIKTAMADTIEKHKQDDPAALRATIRTLTVDLTAARDETARLRVDRDNALTEALTLRDQLRSRPTPTPTATVDLTGIRHALAALTHAYNATAAAENAPTLDTAVEPRTISPMEKPARHRTTTHDLKPAASLPTDSPTLRSGARRMVEALGRMAPLRLTKTQWGTVAHLKTSGGTWSTYLSDIRRAGLIDETTAGYTLTNAGFTYLGGRPNPMTPTELQDHYRRILRAGAAKMLDALITAHPGSLTRDQLGAATDLATTGGTFSTYLSDLTRNGLATRTGDRITATDILIHGALASSSAD